MRTAIVLVLVGICCTLLAIRMILSERYTGPFATKDDIEYVCKKRTKALGTTKYNRGEECAITEYDVSGNILGCRKGVVNASGNACIETASWGVGALAASVLVLICGIVLLCLPSHDSHEKNNRKK